MLSESFDKDLKRGQRRSKSSVEGGKRRGSTKRGHRKSTGSPIIAGNSGDYELTEVIHYEGWSELPSPFLVWAVQLPFHGSLPRSKRGFSLAMWLCLTSSNFGSELDTAAAHANSDSSGKFGSTFEKMNLSRQERIVHLCSIGSGKSLFEVWVIPPDGTLVVRYVCIILNILFVCLIKKDVVRSRSSSNLGNVLCRLSRNTILTQVAHNGCPVYYTLRRINV